MRDRSFARGVAQEHFDRSRPADWFDILYREADGNEKLLPWVGRQSESQSRFVA